MAALQALSADRHDAETGCRPDDPIEQTLGVVRRLARAAAAALVEADRASGTLRVIAEAKDGPAAMPAILTADLKLAAAPASPQWVSAPDRSGATMIVQVADRHATLVFLLLSFPEATTMTRARLAKLTPDLATLVAAQIGAQVRLSETLECQTAQTAALDHGDCGVIALRADYSMLFANHAAAALLAEGDGLQVRRGLVRPSDYREAVRFEAALDAVLDAPRATQVGKPLALMLLLPRPRNARPMIIVMVPAQQPAGLGGSPERCALLYILRTGQGRTQGLDALARLHGLSRVETRLLAHLCAGMTVSEAAGDMRIKLATARAYLKQIFAKTGTHRQTELVTIMARYLRAVRGDFDFQPA